MGTHVKSDKVLIVIITIIRILLVNNSVDVSTIKNTIYPAAVLKSE